MQGPKLFACPESLAKIYHADSVIDRTDVYRRTSKLCQRKQGETIKIENKGDTPTEYRFEEDPTNTFEAKPRLGVVEAGGFTLVALKYTPNEIVMPKNYKKY